MPGRGPAPKDPNRRARRRTGNNDTGGNPWRVVPFVPAPQPELPRGVRWPKRTREWWATWGEVTEREGFTATDWAFLLDTALCHAAVWSGELGRLGELRVRVSKFGTTPEDRLRLRMMFAEAEEMDARQAEEPPAKERYGDLRVLPQAKASGDD